MYAGNNDAMNLISSTWFGFLWFCFLTSRSYNRSMQMMCLLPFFANLIISIYAWFLMITHPSTNLAWYCLNSLSTRVFFILLQWNLSQRRMNFCICITVDCYKWRVKGVHLECVSKCTCIFWMSCSWEIITQTHIVFCNPLLESSSIDLFWHLLC